MNTVMLEGPSHNSHPNSLLAWCKCAHHCVCVPQRQVGRSRKQNREIFFQRATEALVQLIQNRTALLFPSYSKLEHEGLRKSCSCLQGGKLMLNAAQPDPTEASQVQYLRKCKQISLEVLDIQRLKSKEKSKRRRVDVIAAPRRQLWQCLYVAQTIVSTVVSGDQKVIGAQPA